MNKLSVSSFNRSVETILQLGSDLEKALIHLTFFDGLISDVIEALKAYQNPDGGFGKGIEPDFTLPHSSAMATSVGLSTISNYCKDDLPFHMIEGAVRYLKKTFNTQQQRWFAVPAEVNDYPHAPWWHFNEDSRMTVIDYSWGNPTAEIIGYLLDFQDYVSDWDIESLNRLAVETIERTDKFQSEHEIFCYIRLFERQRDDGLKARLEKKITQAVGQLLCRDPSKWYTEYLPKPLDFVQGQDANRFGIDDSLVEQNLQMLITVLDEKECIHPTWQWGQYPQNWQEAKQKWTAILTAKALLQLRAFNQITVN